MLFYEVGSNRDSRARRKSDHRMAAEGMQRPWRWNGSTISLNLGSIREMSVNRFLHGQRWG